MIFKFSFILIYCFVFLCNCKILKNNNNNNDNNNEKNKNQFIAELKSSIGTNSKGRASRASKTIWKSDWKKVDLNSLPLDATNWINATKATYFLFENTLQVLFERKMIGYVNRVGAHCPNAIWNGVNTGKRKQLGKELLFF